MASRSFDLPKVVLFSALIFATSLFCYLNQVAISVETITNTNFRNQRRAVDDLNAVQKMVYSTVKRWAPSLEESGVNPSFVEQMLRRQRVKDVCKAFVFESPAMGPRRDRYQARSPIFSQQIQPHSFLIAHLPPAVLCYNNKVASSTWMSTFAKLLNDHSYYDQLSKSGHFYQ